MLPGEEAFAEAAAEAVTFLTIIFIAIFTTASLLLGTGLAFIIGGTKKHKKSLWVTGIVLTSVGFVVFVAIIVYVIWCHFCF